ncbi:PDE2A isoform 5 [Pan troglodytes]|uniref:Phosphodiesterase 2A n=3 Tax=Hominidae TaxID=9604 RepID=F5H2V7_HUMAN|nr:PDE2A isoform 5 [Pan troglodytes]PNJ51485.1 PDE2A isoform 5 [Pongo abelii]
MGQACGHSILCRSQQYPAARPAEPQPGPPCKGARTPRE